MRGCETVGRLDLPGPPSPPVNRLARLLGFALLAIGLVAVAAVVAGLVASEDILRWRGYKPAGERLVTGILVAGTRERPVLYVTSSDPRIGGGSGDTNSGVVSRLTRTERGWEPLDLVRGLPRSRADHAPNGLALDARRGVLYVAQGSNANMGAPSRRFGGLPEYALSGAILAIDLRRIGGRTYDLPTLDGGGPFGGRGGRGQARLPPRGPVSIHAPGFRNPYDLVLTRSGRLYVTDNGPNLAWGGPPAGEGPEGRCTSVPREGGVDGLDTLHRIPGPGSYGGHPNPERGCTDPRQCDYVPPARRPALARFDSSTNGLAV